MRRSGPAARGGSRLPARRRAPATSEASAGGGSPHEAWSRARPRGSSTRASRPKVTIPARSSGPALRSARRTHSLAPSRTSAGDAVGEVQDEDGGHAPGPAPGRRSPARARTSEATAPRRSHRLRARRALRSRRARGRATAGRTPGGRAGGEEERGQRSRPGGPAIVFRIASSTVEPPPLGEQPDEGEHAQQAPPLGEGRLPAGAEHGWPGPGRRALVAQCGDRRPWLRGRPGRPPAPAGARWRRTPARTISRSPAYLGHACRRRGARCPRSAPAGCRRSGSAPGGGLDLHPRRPRQGLDQEGVARAEAPLAGGQLRRRLCVPSPVSQLTVLAISTGKPTRPNRLVVGGAGRRRRRRPGRAGGSP